MTLAVVGGIEIDLATKDDVAEALATRERPRIPAKLERLRAGAASKATPIVIDLSRPPDGLVWIPQSVTVWGNDAFTTVANVSWVLFAGPLPTGSVALAVGPPVTGLDQGDPLLTGGNSGISVPSTQSIPDDHIVYDRDNLYVVLSGSGLAAGATSYKAICSVIVLSDTDVSAYLLGR